MSQFPSHAQYVIIGAGIHGLSTAMHLARKLAARGMTVGPGGTRIVVLDKTGIGAGASGIACGVVRNNYYQPAMRELMAHCVSVWESDPEAYSYHPVGYMQISPEVDARAGRHDLRAAAGDRLRVRVRRRRGRVACATCRACFHDWQAKQHHVGAAREARRLREQHGVDARARGARRAALGVEIVEGVAVTGMRGGNGAAAITARRDVGRRRSRATRSSSASGRGSTRSGTCSTLPKTISDQGPRRQACNDGIPMWHYMALQEGTLGVDPDYQKTNDGGCRR